MMLDYVLYRSLTIGNLIEAAFIPLLILVVIVFGRAARTGPGSER